MDSETLQSISEIAGLFARGFKKIKGICDKLAANNQEVPQTDESSEEITSQMEEDSKINEVDVLLDDFQERTMDYVKSSKLIVGQRRQTLDRFFQCLLQKRVRQDRFKNTWVFNSNKNFPKTHRKAWKKISEDQINEIYLIISDVFEFTFKQIFQRPEKPSYMSKFRWKRREILQSIELPLNIWACKPFRSILLNNHLELGALR